MSVRRSRDAPRSAESCQLCREPAELRELKSEMEEGGLDASPIITRPRCYGFFFPPGTAGLRHPASVRRHLPFPAAPGAPSTAVSRLIEGQARCSAWRRAVRPSSRRFRGRRVVPQSRLFEADRSRSSRPSLRRRRSRRVAREHRAEPRAERLAADLSDVLERLHADIGAQRILASRDVDVARMRRERDPRLLETRRRRRAPPR